MNEANIRTQSQLATSADGNAVYCCYDWNRAVAPHRNNILKLVGVTVCPGRQSAPAFGELTLAHAHAGKIANVDASAECFSVS